MSLQPDDKPSELERGHWDGNSGIRGRLITLDRLREVFPETQTRGPVEIVAREGSYIVFGRKIKGSKISSTWLAYECAGCECTFGGPPKIREDPKVSKYNWDMYCHGCDEHLAESPMRESL